jgi:hypothetical protein
VKEEALLNDHFLYHNFMFYDPSMQVIHQIEAVAESDVGRVAQSRTTGSEAINTGCIELMLYVVITSA